MRIESLFGNICHSLSEEASRNYREYHQVPFDGEIASFLWSESEIQARHVSRAKCELSLVLFYSEFLDLPLVVLFRRPFPGCAGGIPFVI